MKIIRKIISLLRGDPQNLSKLLDRGLVVGKDFCRMSGVTIDSTHCYHITIGDNVTLAPRVQIIAHDASTYLFLGYTRAANVKIGNNVFIGASSIILPGVTIGDNVVVGAGSVVTKDIPSNSVACGNPANVICTLDTYIAREKAKMNAHNCFSGLWYEGRPDDCKIAIEAAKQYGEIFVN